MAAGCDSVTGLTVWQGDHLRFDFTAISSVDDHVWSTSDIRAPFTVSTTVTVPDVTNSPTFHITDDTTICLWRSVN